MHRQHLSRLLPFFKSSPASAAAKVSSNSRSFSSVVHNIEAREFKFLISHENSLQTPSTTIENILQDRSVQNEKETVQIIDVREKNELERLNFSDDFNRIINLPMSESEEWAPKILTSELLDSSKPTVCVCHAGVRSLQVAQFLTKQGGFEQVYNLVGGIGQYERDVDSSVRKNVKK